MSEDLCALVPSLDAVKGALSMAKSWLIKSRPYLVSDVSDTNSLLKVDDLKELVLESKSLNMCLEEKSLLEDVLEKYIKWEKHACCALNDAESLLNVLDVRLSSDHISKIGDQIAKMESIMKVDFSFRFDSHVVPKLQETCAFLHWCFIALNFHAVDPTLKVT